jgi:hypothetical protein
MATLQYQQVMGIITYLSFHYATYLKHLNKRRTNYENNKGDWNKETKLR